MKDWIKDTNCLFFISSDFETASVRKHSVPVFLLGYEDQK